MRKALVLAAMLLVLALCGCYPPVDEGDRLRVSESVYTGSLHVGNDSFRLFTVEIDGHEYIVMTGYNRSGICHKASCKYCKGAGTHVE